MKTNLCDFDKERKGSYMHELQVDLEVKHFDSLVLGSELDDRGFVVVEFVVADPTLQVDGRRGQI